ncbi:hypothetical protein [Paenibacillus polymyxa]|uniref:hypothetical protein n=1 Tax=Paenibacillus polymyxa TaxID=1406 RepID=UPI0021C5707C|nr:hypothetical protein [Paenibacillus polymyxa]
MSERTYKLQKGDQVVMHTCMEHDHPDNFGKIWTCRSDEFQHKGHDYGSIFLEGFSGSFSTEFLQKVDVPALVDSLQQQLAERDRTIDRLRKSLEATVIPFKFYADPNTYDPAHLDKFGYIIIDEDGGASAKDALAAVMKALGRE